MSAEQQRDVTGPDIGSVGRVVARPDQIPPWGIHDPLDEPLLPARQYLTDLVARDMSPGTIRSYAFDLLRWYRVLWAWGIEWDHAGSGEVRDFVLWMRQAEKRRPTASISHVPGHMNVKTSQQALGGEYASATINHNLSVIQEFYRFHIEEGRGPVRNPVPAREAHPGGGRFGAHHCPEDQFPKSTRARYRQKRPEVYPRSIPDKAVAELVTNLLCVRDRALVELSLSNGARAAELLTLTHDKIDPGNSTIGVVRKGTRNLQWIPVSREAMQWVVRYQRSLPPELTGPTMPLWWTRRKPYRPLTYVALRAMFRKVNQVNDMNWTFHALRHTAAVRMVSDSALPLSYVQRILGHVWITTTQRYLVPRDSEILEEVQAHYRRLSSSRSPAAPGLGEPAAGSLSYDGSDMEALFGEAE